MFPPNNYNMLCGFRTEVRKFCDRQGFSREIPRKDKQNFGLKALSATGFSLLRTIPDRIDNETVNPFEVALI